MLNWVDKTKADQITVQHVIQWEKREKTANVKLTSHGMIIDVFNRKITGINLISFFVWNLQLELLFKSHYNLHIVQAIQAQILLEMYIRSHLQMQDKL